MEIQAVSSVSQKNNTTELSVFQTLSAIIDQKLLTTDTGHTTSLPALIES